MRMKRVLLLLALAMFLTGVPAQAVLVNGDFEDTEGWGVMGDPYTAAPPGWRDSDQTGPVRDNAAVPQSGINAIGGSGTSAYFAPDAGVPSSQRKEITQVLPESTGPLFRYEFDFATEDPGTGSSRCLNMNALFDDGGSLDIMLSLRINGDGDLQSYTGSWDNILTDAVIFDDDVSVTPLVHRMVVTVDTRGETATWDVTIIDSDNVEHSATGLADYDPGGTPVTGEGGLGLIFNNWASSAAYVIDNVELNTLLVTNPSPADGASGVETAGLTLSGDPADGGPYTYDIYLGTTSLSLVESDAATPSYTPAPELALGTTYQWRIDTVEDGEVLSTGPVWTFSTAGKAADPFPADGSEKVGYDTVVLNWADDPLAASYDVYFGTSSGSLSQVTNTTVSEYQVDVDPNAMYYWQVDIKDGGDSVILAGDEWSFSTGVTIANWKLDDAGGTTATDSISGLNGTVADSNKWTIGVDRGGLSFDGEDDIVTAGFEPALQFEGTDQFSLFGWFKTSTDKDQHLMGWMSPSSPYTGYALLLENSPNGIRSLIRNDYQSDAIGALVTAPIFDGQWHHIGFTYDGSGSDDGITMYLDGVEVSSSKSGGTLTGSLQNTEDFTIGARGSSGSTNFAACDMDELYVFNAVLTAPEVQALYSQTARAMAPVPEDGATRVLTDVVCEWTPGSDIDSQVFLLDDDPNLADDLLEEVALSDTDSSRDPLAAIDLDLNTTYYWRVDSIQGSYTIEGQVWSFTTIPPVASDPDPANNAIDVAQNQILTWLPGFGYDVLAGDEHQVYIAAGSSGEDLPGTPTATVASEAFDPDLEFSTQYVWRVDEVIDGTTFTGDVWVFTTGEPECESELLADTNGDCIVDLTDFSQLALEWLDCTLINGDCP